MKLLTESELAAELRCSVRTVQRMAIGRRLPYVKVGSRRKYDPETVKAKLQKGTI